MTSRMRLLVSLFAVAVSVSIGTASSRADTIRIVIDKLVYSPANVTAKVGDIIEWENRDALAHTATVKGDWEVMIPAKKTVSQTLTKEESVEYYCRFHPNMKGRLAVGAK